MDMICIKMDEKLMKSMQDCMETENYSTTTEFVREAIRDKIKNLEKENTKKKLEKYFGSVKTRITDEQYQKNRQEAYEEITKNLE